MSLESGTRSSDRSRWRVGMLVAAMMSLVLMGTLVTQSRSASLVASFRVREPDDTLRLTSVDCEVALRDVYDKVDFTVQAEQPSPGE